MEEDPMSAPELLAELRAAGVEPASDDDVLMITSDFLGHRRNAFEWPVKLAVDLLEARAKLAEAREQLANADAAFADVRKLAITATGKVLRISEWARGMAPDTPGAECAAAVLEILDREPEP